MTQWKPTHELFDAEGESVGLYRKDGAYYCDELTWRHGGRYLSPSDMRMLELTPKPLSK